MAISRRSTNRFNASIWPGFVDAMTGLLLVLMFVITIFMVIQFVLREKITGQETRLEELSSEIASLTNALGLEQSRSSQLASQVGQLTTDLSQAQDDRQAQAALIASLTAERDRVTAELVDAQSRITGFEAQIAGLLADRTDLRDQVAGLETEQARLMSEAEALNLALATARSEIDDAAENARLAAARREALEALIADLEAKRDQDAATIAELETGGAARQAQVSELEAARLADAAALEALRARLADADAEITAMTLALEQQRKEAEDTLTLLAAAEAARDDLAAQQTEQLTEAERQAALLAVAQQRLTEEEALSAESQRQVAALNANVAELRSQVANLQGLLDLAEQADTEAQVQITNLSGRLNQALARAAAENARRLELEEAERARLEAETKELANYRSEFFGQMRQVLADQDGVRIEGDRFVFASEVLFPPGSATLSPLGQAEVAKVATLLRQVADNIPDSIDWIIRVDGHTDNIPLSGLGEFRDNWELSQARALSVVRFMSESQGIDPTHLSANGFGEYQPLNTEDSDAARAQNRRIELKLTER
ncbi:peptidoglycan -binding protein [Marivivens sp. JLT3646]|uniref:peptidoglycan -binding protein n=1 Tax=Marivivens sp. JLT3646 TaxID=1920883 RepID=UPI000800BB58|nr:peptidoglycan -binding protein [Marivivens sp. JLT3646]APO87457.1 flagellar motor protein [Marivivens sp. JLT3646]OBR35965.1 flagellar motor protein [Donghicola sp. JL3646]